MKEYIKRAAVKDEILSLAVCINHPELLSKEDTMFCIDNVPAADVVEVRHGRWNNINPTVLNPGINWVCRCSLCGCPQDYKHNYCPNCGALMDGKEG